MMTDPGELERHDPKESGVYSLAGVIWLSRFLSLTFNSHHAPLQWLHVDTG